MHPSFRLHNKTHVTTFKGYVSFRSLSGTPTGAFLYPNLNVLVMEGLSDQPGSQSDPQERQKQQVEAATDFLSICDRLSTGYDSGYYWEDVQRALRIAAGLEPWPD